MTEALRQLDAEGFFGPHRAGALLFITSSDWAEAHALEAASALALNRAHNLASLLAELLEFVARFGAQE